MKAILTGLLLSLLVTSAWAGTLTDTFDDGNMDEWTIGESPNNKWKIENGVLIVETGVDSALPFFIGEETWGDYTVDIKAKIVTHQPPPDFFGISVLRTRSNLDLDNGVLVGQTGYVFGIVTFNSTSKEVGIFQFQGGVNHLEVEPFEWELDTLVFR